LLAVGLVACQPADQGQQEEGAAEAATAEGSGAGHVVEITAVDYGFDAPDTIRAGWITFRMANEGSDMSYTMNVVPTAAVAATLLLGLLASNPTIAAAQEVPEADTRETIVLPEKVRQTVLREMRQMLEALQGVLAASVEMDRERMAEAALSGGTRIAVDTDPAVARRLPEEFIRLGSATHRDFDALAEVIREGASRDSVLARMGGLTAKCVSCHASYQVVRPGDEN
jgi:cytochrome c556